MAEELKSICLIKGEEPFWQDVKTFLSRTNAEVFSLDSTQDLTVLEGLTPSLIIMNTETYITLPPTAGNCMKLIVDEGDASPKFRGTGNRRKIVMIDWPQEERVFLELTSRLLSIPPRRFFRGQIRILPKDASVSYAGESEDFSLTGLGFKSRHALHEGEEVKISFSLPNKHQSAQLEAEVVRCRSLRDDSSTLYGARYVSLATDTKNALAHFVQRV